MGVDIEPRTIDGRGRPIHLRSLIVPPNWSLVRLNSSSLNYSAMVSLETDHRSAHFSRAAESALFASLIRSKEDPFAVGVI
jgi:hypothetical protein